LSVLSGIGGINNPYGGTTPQDEYPLGNLKPISIKNFDPAGNAPESKGLVDKRNQKAFTKDLNKINQLLAPFEA